MFFFLNYYLIIDLQCAGRFQKISILPQQKGLESPRGQGFRKIKTFR